MKRDDLENAMDLEREDFDPEVFAAALAVQHTENLLLHGGNRYGRPDDEDSLRPEQFERFVPRAFENAQRTKRFEDHWRRMHQVLPRIKMAWEKGHVLFQEHLTRAMTNQEDMEYLSQIDFAVDCYAYVSAHNTYPHDRALQNWAINGYVLAWRQHFLTDDDTSQ